jgi:glycosyltransferase involved in cell wall biosynthesis
MTPPVSVVIAAHNAEDTLGEQLDALLSQEWPNGGEIIVSDNGSTDATSEVARRRIEGPVNVRVIDASHAPGAGHARNQGVRNARFEHIAFCDADDVVGDGWVIAIGQALQHTPAVGGRLELDRLNDDWIVGSRGERLTARSLPLFDGLFPVLSSCNLGIRRATFDAMGGFDESYIRGQDAELSFRLFEAKIPTGFADDALIHYRMRSSLRSVFVQALGWGEVQQRLRRKLPEDADLPTTRDVARSWLWLAVNAPLLVTLKGRARWAYVAGIRVGAFRGRKPTLKTPATAA